MAPGAMFSYPAPEPGADFNVVMIGAGVSRLSRRVWLKLTVEHHVRI